MVYAFLNGVKDLSCVPRKKKQCILHRKIIFKYYITLAFLKSWQPILSFLLTDHFSSLALSRSKKAPKFWKSPNSVWILRLLPPKLPKTAQRWEKMPVFLSQHIFTDIFHKVSCTCYTDTSTNCGHSSSSVKELKFMLNRWLL